MNLMKSRREITSLCCGGKYAAKSTQKTFSQPSTFAALILVNPGHSQGHSSLSYHPDKKKQKKPLKLALSILSNAEG